MAIHDEFGSTSLKCPYYKTPMNLMCGNPVFSYWGCETCHKDFEFNIWIEKFTDEINN